MHVTMYLVSFIHSLRSKFTISVELYALVNKCKFMAEDFSNSLKKISRECMTMVFRTLQHYSPMYSMLLFFTSAIFWVLDEMKKSHVEKLQALKVNYSVKLSKKFVFSLGLQNYFKYSTNYFL